MDGGAWWAAVHGIAKSQTYWGTSPSLSLSCTGEGNGNPLQCSCLENPRNRGVWWAAVYGAPQGRTQLKQLSSSSSCIAGWLFTIWATREAWASWKVAPNWPKGGRRLPSLARLGVRKPQVWESSSTGQGHTRCLADALFLWFRVFRVVHYHFTTFPLWWNTQRKYKEFSFVSCVTSRIYNYA